MAFFSDDYQNKIAEIVEEAINSGYTKLEIINLLADVISYFSAE